MSDHLEPIRYPELIFGIAGAIGVNLDAIEEALEAELADVKYKSWRIKITDEMTGFPFVIPIDSGTPVSDDFYSSIIHKIQFADQVCRKYKDKSALARVAVRAIVNKRIELTAESNQYKDRTAFIVRQFKRPEEIYLLRRLYGKQFILISAYGSTDDRRKLLRLKLRRSLSPAISDVAISNKVEELLDIDQREARDFLDKTSGTRSIWQMSSWTG